MKQMTDLGTCNPPLVDRAMSREARVEASGSRAWRPRPILRSRTFIGIGRAGIRSQAG